VEESQRRIARNEAVFRRVNEALRTGRWPDPETAGDAFRCECAQLGCTRLIELTNAEYERVRAHPRRFLLAPGHEIPEAETVVERGAGYIVVEKRGSAATIADATDPRR
jgi:hypothetical protein